MPVYWFPVAAQANSVGTFQVTIVKLATYPKQCWIIYCAKWVEISLFRVTTLSRGRVGEWKDEPKADPKLRISSRVVLRTITWKSLSTVSQVLLNSIEVVIRLPAGLKTKSPASSSTGKRNSDRSLSLEFWLCALYSWISFEAFIH